MARLIRLIVFFIVVAGPPALAWAQQSAPDAAPASPVSPAAQAAPGTEAPPATEATTSMLPQFAPGLDAADYSPWGMFLAADAVVKGVILALLFASVVTWTVLLAKSLELHLAAKHQRRALGALAEAPSLEDAARGVGKSAVAADLVRSAVAEIDLSADMLGDREGIKERVASRLERLEAAASRRIALGIGLLATIGATAPFVGLFGTVWGIMNSFIGIANAQTTNLAVVAPGIAEALLATAIGLGVAIPAVVFYNHFARRIAAYRALVADTVAAVLRIVSRDLGRAARAPGSPVRRAAAE